MRKTISYGRQFIDEEDIRAVVKALTSDFMTQGPLCSQFEQYVAGYHNCKYAVAFSNGTTALHAAYHALGIKEGDEIITTPNTFVASANGALYCGGIPKFVDIDADTYNIDLNKIEAAITERTKVITPVSFAGYPVDIKRLKEIIGTREIKIIHDAAHAIGARIDGHNIADFADCTILSFHPVKHVATGEGGMVLTNDARVYEALKLFRTHGITKEEHLLHKNDGPWYYEMQELGNNYRITEMQCALGISQMKKLNQSLIQRNRIAAFYEEELKDIPGLKLPLSYFSKEWINDNDYISMNKKIDNLCSYHLYPVLVENKEVRLDFFNYLRSKGLMVQVHYIPVHLQPYYQEHFGFKAGDFPIAEQYYEREVSIPMYPTLSDEDLDYIVKTIKAYFKK
ncbi:MAG: UDP-4-amino-4,6-dideoxy-N-acetyl-beta-L-altrosamine transaminase [Erysipelotrichaceae bacterium]